MAEMGHDLSVMGTEGKSLGQTLEKNFEDLDAKMLESGIWRVPGEVREVQRALESAKKAINDVQGALGGHTAAHNQLTEKFKGQETNLRRVNDEAKQEFAVLRDSVQAARSQTQELYEALDAKLENNGSLQKQACQQRANGMETELAVLRERCRQLEGRPLGTEEAGPSLGDLTTVGVGLQAVEGKMAGACMKVELADAVKGLRKKIGEVETGSKGMEARVQGQWATAQQRIAQVETAATAWDGCQVHLQQLEARLAQLEDVSITATSQQLVDRLQGYDQRLQALEAGPQAPAAPEDELLQEMESMQKGIADAALQGQNAQHSSEQCSTAIGECRVRLQWILDNYISRKPGGRQWIG